MSGSVTVNVNATDNNKVARITLVIDGKEVAGAYGSSLSYTWSVPKTRSKRQDGTVTIIARAEDPAGNQATASVTVKKQ